MPRRNALRISAMSALCLMTFGCTKLKDKTITEDNRAAIMKDLKESKDVTDEERHLLLGYLLRNGLKDAFAGKEPSLPAGKTIQAMIDEQRAFLAAEKAREEKEAALREQARAEETRRRRALQDALTVTIFAKGMSEEQFRKNIVIKCAYENQSGKDIKGFKGSLVALDMFGDTITTLGIKEDGALPAGQTKQVVLTKHYNEFIDTDRKFASIDLDKMKVQWMPDLILFADGTRMAAGAAEP